MKILFKPNNRLSLARITKILIMKRHLVSLLILMIFSCSKNDSDPIIDAESSGDSKNTGNFVDEFDDSGDLVNFVTNNPAALPEVSQTENRYRALLIDNSDNITLHFHEKQGRLDAKLLEFPFEFIARNIGIGMVSNSQVAPTAADGPYIFSGVQVHVEDLNSFNSSHVVVGHRGSASFTIEGKNTLNGVSSVNDIGKNSVPDGRADLRIVGNEDRTITVYWQLPNTTGEDNWILYRDTGNLPGTTPDYGNSVYVGLITYAFGDNGVPFVGTCDAIEIDD